MEVDARHPQLRSPRKHSQRNRPPQDEFSLLPDELRRNCFGDLVPQPPLAPNLANRLHRRNGRLAVPLLSPRLAAGGVRETDWRPGCAGGAFGAHGGCAAPHRCSVEHRGVPSGRSSGGSCSRSNEEDGGFVC
ncbi:unnamed protein product [Linum tenue]|uniref:Uncharacterized protein n=2 Tax=Linum tenue TaxID=586396 RepID=A0AAV0NUU5_9ROSI|nr:unnamed protein product [Linum tenue]